MNISTLQPNFGQNYDVGFVGFTSRSDDLVAKGIAWFERWDVPNAECGVRSAESSIAALCNEINQLLKPVPVGITVEHALIVTGPDECVEAHAGTGVQKATLSKYFNDPHCRIFFRKPKGWSQITGEDIAWCAEDHIGEKYGYGTIIADALANSWLGHWLNQKFKDRPNRIISRLFASRRRKVCSQLAALALKEVLPHLGCLAKPAREIDPQELFEDPVIFEPWSNTPPITTRAE